MSVRGEPPSEPGLLLAKSSVSERMLRLARWLGISSIAIMFGPPLVSVVIRLLRAALGAPEGESYEPSIILSGWFICTLLAPVLAMGSAIVAIPTIRGWRGPARVLVNAEGLTFERGESVVKTIVREQITDAVVVPAPDPSLDVHLAGGNVLSITLPCEERGHEGLEALGFSPMERRISIRLASIQRMVAAGCIGLPVIGIVLAAVSGALHDIGMPKTTSELVFLLVAFSSTWLLVRAQKPHEVVVGMDGVVVRRAFSRTYHSYADIEIVQAQDNELRWRLRGTKWFAAAAKGEPRLVQAAAKRIDLARRTGALVEDGARVRELLDRKGRTLAEWRTALSGLLLQGGDYRNATVTEEALLAVLEDPGENRGRRIGAAMILRIAVPEAAPRIRIAAETSADDELRAALERAAEEELDDATLERVLRVTRGS